MWRGFKKSGGRSIIAHPFFLCEAALLPFRAIYDYKNGDSDSDSEELEEHARMGCQSSKEPPHDASDRLQHDRSKTKHKKSKKYLKSYGYRERPIDRTLSNVDAAFPNMYGNGYRQYNVAPFFAPPHTPNQIPQPPAARVKPKLTRYTSDWQRRQLGGGTQPGSGVPQPVPEQHRPPHFNEPPQQLMQHALPPAPAMEHHTPHPARSRANRTSETRSQQPRSRSQSHGAQRGTATSGAATSTGTTTTTSGVGSSSSSGTTSSTSSGGSSSCECSECASSSGTTSGTRSTGPSSHIPAARSRHGGSQAAQTQQPHQGQ